MPTVAEAESKRGRPDRAPLFIIGLALIALAMFAFQAMAGHHVRWWNWVISSLVIVNTAVGSLPALRARPTLSIAISRLSLVIAWAVIVAIVVQMQG